MLKPDLSTAQSRLEDHRILPVHRTFSSDILTPVSAYLSLTEGGRRKGFLLESVEQGERIGRYTFLGTEPSGEVRVENRRVETRGDVTVPDRDDPFEGLKRLIDRWDFRSTGDLPRFTGGLVGYLGYEMIRYIEPTVPVNPPDEDCPYPDCRLLLVDRMLIFDHVERSVHLVGHLRRDHSLSVRQQYEREREHLKRWKDKLVARPDAPRILRPDRPVQRRVQSNVDPEEFHRAVRRIKASIRAGETFQVVVSQRFQLEDPNHPFNLYRRLRSVNPSPYMFYLDFDAFQLVGSSPEVMVQKQKDTVRIRPIAGTRRRGETPEEDRSLAEELKADVKEQAEHTMLVDLGRNDIGRVCRPGSVEVTGRAFVERYSHVMHLVSNAEGTLREDKDAIDVLKAAFPAGTVTGAPKVRAMQIINDCEPDRRGPYSGAVGYVSFQGDLDTCIVIRTIVHRDGVLQVQAGAGIVADSQPEREFEETREKARALMNTIDSLPQTEFL